MAAGIEFISRETLFTKRNAIPAQRNPLDKCTIVSLYPRDIVEVKHTLTPGKFKVPGGSSENPGILVVGSSSWWKDAGDDTSLIEILVGSILIAESIIRDYCNGLIECDMGDSMPGMFFVLGEHDQQDILHNYQDKIKIYEAKQRNWFTRIIAVADSLWAKTNGNPFSIPDDARIGAELLGKKDRPWMGSFRTVEVIACVACCQMRNPQFPVCPACHNIVDRKLAEELGIIPAAPPQPAAVNEVKKGVFK